MSYSLGERRIELYYVLHQLNYNLLLPLIRPTSRALGGHSLCLRFNCSFSSLLACSLPNMIKVSFNLLQTHMRACSPVYSPTDLVHEEERGRSGKEEAKD